MGKKVKPKTKNPRKVQLRTPSGTVPPDSDPGDVVEDGGDNIEKDGAQCSHYGKNNSEMNRILCGILSSKHASACEDCREEPPARRGGKDKGKQQQQKKKGGAKQAQEKSDSNFFWVCLDCNRHYCGGAVDQKVPYGHCRRHSKQAHHSLVVRFDDPTIGWCFSCNLQVQVDLPNVVAGEEESKSKKNNAEVENGVVSLAPDVPKGYVVRGLTNLGNTCFFNSVMQNLLALDMLRDYMINLDKTVGPLTMALKKFFLETNGGADSRGVLSPRNLFGCICAKASQFRGYDQQDSHELLRCLLDGLHVEETNPVKPHGSTTMVDMIFGGQLSSTICCMECGYTSIINEPFLDLSLPVPSKKTISKKVLSSSAKRAKTPLKERNKSRRFREKGTSKGSIALEPSGVDKSFEPCSKFDVPQSKPEENIGSKVDKPSTCDSLDISTTKAEDSNASDWMDYLDHPHIEGDARDSDARTYGESFAQSSGNEQISQTENGIQCSFEAHTNDVSKEISRPMASPEEASSSVQNSDVILLPYEELNSVTNQISSLTLSSQNQETISSIDGVTTEANLEPSYGPAYEQQPEAEFDGFGDMFNEPEVTSEPKTETGTAGEMTLWASNSSDSNQEDVDNSNVPVSINSCLALFTKPELLSNEHAWYCDKCSGLISTKMSLPISDNLEEKDSQTSEDQESTSSNLQVGYQNSGDFDAVEAVDMKITSTNADSDAGTSNLSQIFPESYRGSENTKEDCGETSEEKILAGSMLCNQASSNHVILVEKESRDLGLSKNTGAENVDASKNTGAENVDAKCIIFDKENFEPIGQAPASMCTSLQGPLLAFMSNSCKPNDFGDNNAQKNGRKLSGHARQIKGIKTEKDEPERGKVKRDATKRILINKIPSVLTIHLKRFSQDARGRLTKLNGHVDLQEMLDLKPYLDSRCNSKCIYRLVGVVEHSGSMRGGHYVAYVRGEKHGSKIQQGVNSASWFYISDAHVRETTLSEVLKTEAYILFYEKA